jgi:hypothetical protein
MPSLASESLARTIATRLSGHLDPGVRPANRDSAAGSAGGGESPRLVGEPPGSGDGLVGGGGERISTAEGPCAARRGSSVRGAGGRVRLMGVFPGEVD